VQNGGTLDRCKTLTVSCSNTDTFQGQFLVNENIAAGTVHLCMPNKETRKTVVVMQRQFI
jgi:hypothetical protein